MTEQIRRFKKNRGARQEVRPAKDEVDAVNLEIREDLWRNC